MRLVTLMWTTVAVTVLAAGCSGTRIVSSDEPPVTTPATTTEAPPLPPPNSAYLVDAADYVAYPGDSTGYFFTTPSGRWACAILPRVKAGCQSASGSGLGITGAPTSVTDAAGEPTSPDAITVGRDGEAQFVALERPEFTIEPGPAKVLEFNTVLVVAGFRCNVQEEFGVSCASERSGKGFTFSAEDYLPQYTDVQG